MTEILSLLEITSLRRYAFCLLGNRYLSDMALEGALNAFGNGAKTADDAEHKLALYREINLSAEACSRMGKVSAALGAGLHSRFLRLPMEQRQIAVLHAVMGIPFAGIATIMGMNESMVRGIYTQCLAGLRLKPMAVLIIEDEAIIARELHQIVTKLGLAVAGTARNRTEALRIAGLSKPGLILADYSLRGDTGVNVVKAIRQSIDAHVIYVTAFPDVAAAESETGDIVIPKPFNVRTVEQAVQHMAA
ncbi:MAG: response regulator [Rhodomicrobium sp.]